MLVVKLLGESTQVNAGSGSVAGTGCGGKAAGIGRSGTDV